MVNHGNISTTNWKALVKECGQSVVRMASGGLVQLRHAVEAMKRGESVAEVVSLVQRSWEEATTAVVASDHVRALAQPDPGGGLFDRRCELTSRGRS